MDSRWHEKIIFSDEATCHLNGTQNTDNCYYYSSNNEHRVFEKPIKSASLTVWAMVSYDGRIAFRIINNTMSSDRYCGILNEVVFPTLNSVRYNNHFFQQDGAAVHWSLAVRQLLNGNLPNRWIGRSGSIEWPARKIGRAHV